MPTKTPGDLPRRGEGVRPGPRDPTENGGGNGDNGPTNGDPKPDHCWTFRLADPRPNVVELAVDEPVWGDVRNGRILVLHGSHGVLGLVPDSIASEILAVKNSGSLAGRIAQAASKPEDVQVELCVVS